MKKLLYLLLLGSLILGPAQITLADEAAAPPDSAYVSGLVGHAQQYPLSCESRSAVDLAAFWGVSVSETNFFNSLPSSDNPDKGFVGPVHGSWGQIPPNAYGVHAKPIAKQLKALGLDADWHKGLSWKDLRNEIAAGRPVIVWVIGGVWSGTAQSYTSNDGHTSTVAAYEHTMILIGYDESLVHLVDAGSGRTLTTSVSSFRNSWSVLNNMAVTVSGGKSQGSVETSDNDNNDKQEEPQNTNNNNDYSGETYTVKTGDYLSKIARNFGISWVDLAAINNISYPWTVYAGQVLKLSGKAQANNNNQNNNQQQEEAEEPAQQNNDQVVASGDNYTVQKGEYLAQIARKFGISWVTIADLNNLHSPYIVYPGQVLVMPGSGSANNSQANNSNNNNGNQSQQEEAAAQKPSGDTYTVKKGDYLVALAREWGINWQELAALNNIGYPYTVHPGQVLEIP